MVSATAQNNVVTQTVAPDRATTQLLARYKTFADPIANRVVGSITGSLIAGRDGGDNAAGESTMGDVIADAQLEATKPSDFGGSVVAFMNPGGIRGSLRYTRTDGQPQPVTYGELFTVQPFSNTLVVKTCTGAQIDALLEQQFAGQPDPADLEQPPLQLQRERCRREQGRSGDDQDRRHHRRTRPPRTA